MLKQSALALGILLFFQVTHAQDATPSRYGIIPYPQQLVPQAGEFVITTKTKLVVPAGKTFSNEAAQLQALIKQGLGQALPAGTKAGAGSIVLTQNDQLAGEEDYTLSISTQEIQVGAKTPTGMFRAIQTLRQLMPVAVEGTTTKLAKIAIPAANITDHPAYGWRGMHLDVSRHFFSIGYLKKFINVLALYKMNKFHIHLTDDQGWRIEIKKYPLLTERGAWREFNNQDSACMEKSKTNPDMAIDPSHIIHKDGKTLYGGFYTQAQMKDLIAYAAARHIEIIPEIDMPGHMMAAIREYPFLSCQGGVKWGKLFTTPICPCKESTFEFAENVFTEIAALFPSQYIHLGADEVDKSTWEHFDGVQDFMKEHQIKDVDELQSYFVKRMEKFFNSKGKKLIGWDEILEGGVSPTAMVMYWRTWVPSAPIHAAKNGNYVIMTPGNPLYFDNIPDRNSISNIYYFEPVPKGLTAEEGKFIIGAQANIWTENIPSEKRADFMYMPRMTALSELLWTNKPDFDAYSQRLMTQYKRLDLMKVNFRMPDLDGFTEENVFVGKTRLEIAKPSPEMKIRYTTDGSLPTMKSPELPADYIIPGKISLRIAAFKPNGVHGEIYTLNFKPQTFFKPTGVSGLQQGLKLDYFNAAYRGVTTLPATPDSTGFVNNVIMPDSIGHGGRPFGATLKGFINVPETTVYSFFLTADDGANLYIDGEKVVDNDGWHAPLQKSGQIALQKGLHPIEVKFVEGGGGYTLKLEYRVNGGKIGRIPDEWLQVAK
ncbi:family 20 glycosylhydrolase [Chitinophaga sancti]|uniref:beta-N-acetylhexosaminidase n=1 Tax=Chitinophaga sancti TaxID=1004 RepID=A0A1K1R6T9_9BACT|nr:family 20 glycosylhydrolase [Chitinophaga sancti]WQD64186.1 family 20 glycosylhydrolase [Chitinophaga sancti]WQG90190.1 family 20 glycosylhydrolase [Chitinophaga sancti]SFW67649.1 hexosaminidase [Chitinophaga sancti]